ncbi:MAG TPA: LysM peptidoglycan-binding domain-containing protein [Patescibacteria group bacterium]|nr:LysM peptidoglycan-binding domain-containing protein [Patescibacteria group bacterium]
MLSIIQRLFLVIVLVAGSWSITSARTIKSPAFSATVKAGIALPSAPDETQLQRSGDERVITLKLEQARRKYLKALGFVDKGDTLQAARHFEQAMGVLNELASQPGIEQNEDFTDLAQSIIEDYESYVQNIDNLDENSSIFVVRDKLFMEVERSIATQRKPVKIQPLKPQPDETVISRGSTTTRAVTIPMTSNEYVDKSIAFMTQDKGRKYYTKWLERSTKWFPMMKKIAREEGMPEEIIYLSMIESGLNHNAVSWAKAVGLWQFMPATGQEYDLRVDGIIDERRDPEKATRSAMRFLKHLYNNFGDWHLALAGYNCGAGGVRRAIRESGLSNPNFWQIREFLPKETRSYVPLYIAAATIGMDPENYGFKKEELNYEPQYAYDVFTVTEQISLTTLAKCANIPVEELKLLNSHLLKPYTPARGEFALKIPSGTASMMAANYAALSPSEKQPWITHTVRRGETLNAIASQYGMSVKELASINDLAVSTKKIKAGRSLRIPNGGSSSEAEKVMFAGNTTPTKSSTTSQAEPTDEPEPAKPLINSKKQTLHVVRQGENLYSIARRYGVRLTDLRNWNNIPYEEDAVRAGAQLIVAQSGTPLPQSSGDLAVTSTPILPDPKAQPNTAAVGHAVTATPKTPVVKVVQHKVVRGETLAQIADDYGVSMESIRASNKLKKKGRIAAGQTLTIRTTTIENAVTAKPAANLAVTTQKTHKVKKGENIGTIAALYGVEEADLKRWNAGSVKGNKVLAGSTLKVYGEPESKGSAKARSKEVNKLPKQYTVRNGDNLSEIARKFGVSIAELKAKNKKLKGDNLQKGQKLRIQ